MYEDRIEIEGRTYNVVTSESRGRVFSVIYTEKSNQCEIIRQNQVKIKDGKEKEMALKNLHEKFLSMLFRSIKKSEDGSNLDFDESGEELPAGTEEKEDPSGKRTIETEETKRQEESDKRFRTELLEFCQHEVTDTILMCLLTDGDAVAVYYLPDLEDSLHEYLQNEIMKIMEAVDRNGERIVHMIGEYRQVIVSSDDYNYFYAVLKNGLVSVIATPGGQLGRYAREIDRFNAQLDQRFSKGEKG